MDVKYLIPTGQLSFKVLHICPPLPTTASFFKKIIYYFYIHWCFARLYDCVRVLDLGVTGRCDVMWVLGLELGSSERIVRALNC